MKEFKNQEVGKKMSLKRLVSKLIQPDAPGLKEHQTDRSRIGDTVHSKKKIHTIVNREYRPHFPRTG